MTVQELIALLEKFPSDTKVLVTDDGSSGHYLTEPDIRSGFCRLEYGKLYNRTDKKRGETCVVIG